MNNISVRNDITVTNPVTVAADKEEKLNTATNKITALYCKLSQEDERNAESMSIQNQKEMLLNYAKENRFSNPVFYIDDGYTGTNFDRPGFQKMLSDAQTGKVGTIVTKDLSRLGRDSTMVGYYQKYVFPQLEIRYIAVNDHYDSANPNSVDNDMALFKNLFNEFYPLDTSRKIRAVNRMRGESGKTLTFTVPYGYIKDPDDRNHWIVDDEAAKVVKHIFSLCIEGRGPSQIARQLGEEKILNPTAYKAKKGLPINNKVKDDPYKWEGKTVVHMLERLEYTGCTVAFKTYSNSIWDKKIRNNPKENWVITPDTHEAIIDRDTYDKVQIIREKRHRKTKTGKSHMFSGLLYCYDCDSNMYYCTTKYFESRQDFFECAGHHNNHNECKTHFIRAEILEKLVWEHMKAVILYVYCYESYFREYMKRVNESVSRDEVRFLKSQLSDAEKRISEIDRLYTKIYEDNASGKISDDRFKMLSNGYDTEQSELKSKTIQLQKQIESQEQNTENLDKFISLVRSHVEDDGLNGYNLHELIQGIYIENCDVDNNPDGNIEIDDDEGECIIFSKKPKTSTAKKYRIRKIHIKYDFIGFIPVKSLMQYAKESEKRPNEEISA
ncbi:MAG: recombinase family protein [Clostridia bacterium]|nr:recombinase family protein [Clostridia bacterium]